MGRPGSAGWSYYPLHTIPRGLDIVWCCFPLDEQGKSAPGPKPRPALVRAVMLNRSHTKAFVDVTYGTSRRREAERPLDLHICNASEMAIAGLPQATCFVLDRTVALPWAAEFFCKRADGTGPVIGHLSAQTEMQLQALLVMRRQARHRKRT